MIKITIDKGIEGNFFDDMKTREKGLVNVLNDDDTKTFLKSDRKYRRLHRYFYDDTEQVIENNVKKLVLADKTLMERFIKLFGKFDKDDAKKLVEKVFRYDRFSVCAFAYNFLDAMNVNVCPYCNRQYTFTLKNHKARPQFDHYYPKSIYPYLALSMYNLIPSCGICNQAKSALDTVEDPILYPYEDEFGDDVKFKINNKTVKAIYGLSDDFDVKIEPESSVSAELETKVKNQKERLVLDSFYERHKDYIKDLALNHFVNSPARITELITKFPTLFKSEDDVRNTLYMNDIRKDNWGKRPLAKLTSDVIEELEKTP